MPWNISSFMLFKKRTISLRKNSSATSSYWRFWVLIVLTMVTKHTTPCGAIPVIEAKLDAWNAKHIEKLEKKKKMNATAICLCMHEIKFLLEASIFSNIKEKRLELLLLCFVLLLAHNQSKNAMIIPKKVWNICMNIRGKQRDLNYAPMYGAIWVSEGASPRK